MNPAPHQNQVFQTCSREWRRPPATALTMNLLCTQDVETGAREADFLPPARTGSLGNLPNLSVPQVLTCALGVIAEPLPQVAVRVRVCRGVTAAPRGFRLHYTCFSLHVLRGFIFWSLFTHCHPIFIFHMLLYQPCTSLHSPQKA